MIRPGQRHHYRVLCSGLSLVELLVSMLLGLLLSAGVVSVYLSAKRNHLYEEQAARMQENARYAMRLLSRELVMAGFYAGFSAREEIVSGSVRADCSDRAWALDATYPLDMVNDYSGQAVLSSLYAIPWTCLDSSAIALNTDLIAIKRTAGEASLRSGIPATNLSRSTVSSWYLRLTAGKKPAWEKLRAVDLFDRSRAVTSLSYWEAISKIIYIRKYSDSANMGENLPTLCMETLAGDEMTSRCLVEGVENLQLEFGIDTDADGVPNQYQQEPLAAELQRAVTVKIYLLLRSIRQIPGHKDDKSYTLGQTVLDAKYDGYLRRVFSTTVFLRNQVEPIR